MAAGPGPTIMMPSPSRWHDLWRRCLPLQLELTPQGTGPRLYSLLRVTGRPQPNDSRLPTQS
eukprot:2555182-Rhodomonas_salina.2